MAATSRLLRIACAADPGATDGELLRRYVQDRDEAAFAEIVRRNGLNVELTYGFRTGTTTATTPSVWSVRTTASISARRAA